MLRKLGHIGKRQTLCVSSMEVEDCLWPQVGSHKAKGYFLTSVPISVIHRDRWTCQIDHLSPSVQGHFHEMVLEVSFWRMEALSGDRMH